MAETPSEGWATYNQKVLGKNWVLWRTEQQALSLCPWCTEVLVWPDLLKEAVTLNATPDVLEDLKQTVVSKLEDSLRVCAEALVDRMLQREDPGDPTQAESMVLPDIQQNNPQIIMALENFAQRHPAEIKAL